MTRIKPNICIMRGGSHYPSQKFLVKPVKAILDTAALSYWRKNKVVLTAFIVSSILSWSVSINTIASISMSFYSSALASLANDDVNEAKVSCCSLSNFMWTYLSLSGAVPGFAIASFVFDFHIPPTLICAHPHCSHLSNENANQSAHNSIAMRYT